MTERTYLAIDLKSFYASVECMERGLDPMTTNLVVADASRTEKTICLAVSPSLKAYEELSCHFDEAAVSSQNGFGKLLKEELRQREEIKELIMTEDCIEMTYHMEYCENCQQGGLEGAMNLFSLMGCNLYDVHLCDGDEDHELTTVVELNQDTLTEDGRREWSDVLNAKVTSIYEGHYGVQIGLTGCPAERLRDFSFMLAGHCPAEDYDRWVNSGEHEQAQTEPKQFM